jgi:hypothetical protein
MTQPSRLTHVLAVLLLSLTCAACGRAAMTSQPRLDGERRAYAIDLDETNRAWEHDTNGSAFEDPAGERALRQMTDDAGLQDVRATRSGWAASDR